MLTVDERIELTKRLANALGHAVAGPLQSTMNAVFILHRSLDKGGTAPADALRNVEAQLAHVREGLDRITLIATVTRPHEAVTIELRELGHRCIGDNRARVRFDARRGSPAVVVDAARFVMALREIVTNAMEVTPEAEPVGLRLAVSPSQRLVAVVSDRGTRAWPDPVEAAFDPTYTTKPRSVGLGLAIAHAAVRALGGDLRIARRKGKGSTVTVEVPIA